MKYSCPCCGYYTYEESSNGSYEICPVCFWENDNYDYEEADKLSASNGVSLSQARTNYEKYGACASHLVEHVRPPYADEKREANSMRAQFICYKKCSTCQKARKWLDSHGIRYEERAIKEENPTVDELKMWIANSGYPIKKFFNTSGNIYKEQKLNDKISSMTEEEQIQLLATDGMLVKRPILIRGGKILVGFKEEEWEELK